MMPDKTGHIQEKHKSVPTLGSLASRLTTQVNEIHSSSSVVVETSTEETTRFDQATKRKQKTPQQAERAREKQWRTRRMKRAQKAESQRAHITDVEDPAASKSEDDDNEPLDQESSVAASPPAMPKDESEDLNDEGPILKALVRGLRGLDVDPTSTKDLENDEHEHYTHDRFKFSCQKCIFQRLLKMLADDLILKLTRYPFRHHKILGFAEAEKSRLYNTLYSDLSAILMETGLSQRRFVWTILLRFNALCLYDSYVVSIPYGLKERRSTLKELLDILIS